MQQFRPLALTRRSFLALAVATVLLGGGCATLGEPETPEQIISKRAQFRWDDTIAGKIEDAYNFTAPSYRSLVDLKLYRAKYGSGNVIRQGARVNRVYCISAIACKAVIEIDYVMPLIQGAGSAFTPSTTAYEENWVLEDGQWWFYPR